MGKLVHSFDKFGIYNGDVEADESPLEPGVFLMPARTTAVALPDEIPSDKVPRFNGVSWELVNVPSSVNSITALEKLTSFLANNPDVKALIESGVSSEQIN